MELASLTGVLFATEAKEEFSPLEPVLVELVEAALVILELLPREELEGAIRAENDVLMLMSPAKNTFLMSII